MKIARDEGVEAVIMDAMRQSFGPRDGIHLTDLLNPRYAYWQKVDPKPLTNDEMLYFLAGRGHEDAFGRLHGFQHGEETEADGIKFRADFYLTIPTEFKTRRRNLARTGEEAKTYSTYIDQVRGYAALHNRTAAWLWVLSLLEAQADGSTKPALHCYLVEFTEVELKQERDRLQERKVLLEVALLKGTHRILPLCWAFKCGKQSRTMMTLPRCETCQRDFQTDWGLEKHLTSRPDHVINKAGYTSTYQPKCQWYGACEPWKDDPARGDDQVRHGGRVDRSEGRLP